MFEKFTERARRVMGLSRQESQRLGGEFIGTEHILLGILQEGEGLAALVLRKLFVNYKSARQQIEKLVTPSTSSTITLGQLPFSPRAKRVIELASEAASRLGRDVIGTEHLLLGLLKVNEGIAAQVLTNLGLKLDEVRDMVLEVIGAPAPAAVPETPWSDRTRSVVRDAASEARAMRSPCVEPEHLLLAIFGDNGPARELLTRSGITAQAIQGIIPRP